MNEDIYKKTKDNKARFVLGKKGRKTLICIGVNPSTATPSKPDRTIRSVEKFAEKLDYDSWIMLNLYPQRSKDPNGLDEERNNNYHRRNLEHITKIYKNTNCDIWAAWGNLIEKREYLFDCLKDIYEISKKYSVNWYTVGELTKKGKGHPHHPSRLNQNLKRKKFNVKKYIYG